MRAVLTFCGGGDCTLETCPPGLFLFKGTLGVRCEYNDRHGPFAFVANSGEVFWGDATTTEARAVLMVIPIIINLHHD